MIFICLKCYSAVQILNFIYSLHIISFAYCTTLTLTVQRNHFIPFEILNVVGGWLQFGVTVRVRHNKMSLWAKRPRGGDSALRILRMLIRPPANFRQSFAYFWATLCEPWYQKWDFFLVHRYFPLYTHGHSRVPPRGFGRLGQNPAEAMRTT